MRRIFFDRYDLMRLPWVILFGLVGLAAVTAGLMFGGVYAFDRTVCLDKAEALEVDVRWGFWAGCLVADDDGRWFPLDQFREVR